MSPLILHAKKTIVYLLCAGVGAILGRTAANALFSLLPISVGAFFVILCIVAALLFGLVSPLEQRFYWGRWFTASDADLKWIGSSYGNLLTGSIASPVTLGFVLGMLSLLKV